MQRLFGLGILSGLLVVGVGAGAAGPSVAAPVEAAAIQTPAEPGSRHFGIRDEAAMVLVGTILIGLAGALRRAA